MVKSDGTQLLWKTGSGGQGSIVTNGSIVTSERPRQALYKCTIPGFDATDAISDGESLFVLGDSRHAGQQDGFKCLYVTSDPTIPPLDKTWKGLEGSSQVAS